MSRKTLGIVLMVIGILLVVVSLVADMLGIGSVPGFGWKQLLGTAVGVIVALVGIWMTFRKPVQKG